MNLRRISCAAGLLITFAAHAQQPAPTQSVDQKDAAQLSELVKQLKETTDKTSKYELSLKFIKQAKSVEDLARTMRTRKSATAPTEQPQHSPADKASSH